MRSRNTFGIQFIIRIPKNNENELAMVYARVTVNGKRTEISLKSKVLPKDWDVAKEKAKGKREEILKLNNHIEIIRSQVTDSYQQLVQQKEEVTVAKVKSIFLGEEKSHNTIVQLLEYHKMVEGIKLAEGTLKNYRTTERYLKKFIKKKYKSTDVRIEEVNFRFISEFEYF